jgi:hypothetical protein
MPSSATRAGSSKGTFAISGAGRRLMTSSTPSAAARRSAASPGWPAKKIRPTLLTFLVSGQPLTASAASNSAPAAMTCGSAARSQPA